MSSDRSEPNTTLIMASSTSGVVVRKMTLTVIEGVDEGRTLVAEGDRVSIGSDPAAELCLDDPAVSRFHCELVATSDGVVLRDLGSSNGTLVGGVRIGEAYPRMGAVIQIGRTHIRLEDHAESIELPLSSRSSFGTMVGHSPPMRRVYLLLERAAESEVTLLITGETGTGKEAAAESVHAVSDRAEAPFIVVDCSAIPSDLLESELFGHVKGSFTGATADHDGAFRAADGGTIFLDEIGELPLALQPKLLRALESRKVKPVGSSRYVPVDVRVIAATNRDLKTEVNAKRFRSDLYYRLAVLQLTLPPLRERTQDIPALVRKLVADRSGVLPEFLEDPDFLAGLAGHGWTGNVRELRNYVDRCIAMREPLQVGEGPSVAAAGDAGAEGLRVDTSLPFREARERWVSELESRYLRGVLDDHEGNVSAAARTAGLDRAYFYRLLWKHGLK